MGDKNSAFKVATSMSTQGGKLKIGEPCLYVGQERWFICKLYDRKRKRTEYLMVDEMGIVHSVLDGKLITAGHPKQVEGQIGFEDIL